MRSAATLLLAAAALLGLPGTALATSWTTYGFDDQRTGFNPDEHVLGAANAGSLTEAWSVKLGAVSNTSPVTADGVDVGGTPRDLVFAGSEHGLLVAVDAHTGAIVWSRQLGSIKTRCDDIP